VGIPDRCGGGGYLTLGGPMSNPVPARGLAGIGWVAWGLGEIFTAARVGDGGKKVEGKFPSWLQAGICG
jgi:hypothetical protein